MIEVFDAIVALGHSDFVMSGEPETEADLPNVLKFVVDRSNPNELVYSTDYQAQGLTWTAIKEKQAELQADYDSKQYQRDRAAAYPSWQEQLDNIFHNGIDAWKADIQAIKDQFPKP